MVERIGELYKNYVLVSSTGSGKSTTGNKLVDKKVFKESDEFISCTSDISYYESHRLKSRIIDVIGFDDNRIEEKQVENILGKLTENVVSWTGHTTNQIDGFILVQKANPRMSTFKNDIEKMKDLFGAISLKSTVVIAIETTNQRMSDEKFYEQISKMEEIIKQLEEGKGKKFGEDWIIRWDNFLPHENQEEKLFNSLKKVEPYTHQKFLDAQEEIKERMREKIKKEVEKETEKIKRDFANDKEKQQKEIDAMILKFNDEKKRNEDALKKAADYSSAIMSSMQEMLKQNNENFRLMMNQMNEARRQEMEFRSQEFNRIREEDKRERERMLDSFRIQQNQLESKMFNMVRERQSTSTSNVKTVKKVKPRTTKTIKK